MTTYRSDLRFKAVSVLRRASALILSAVLAVPDPAFALRPRSAGLEEKTDVTSRLEQELLQGQPPTSFSKTTSVGLEELTAFLSDLKADWPAMDKGLYGSRLDWALNKMPPILSDMFRRKVTAIGYKIIVHPRAPHDRLLYAIAFLIFDGPLKKIEEAFQRNGPAGMRAEEGKYLRIFALLRNILFQRNQAYPEAPALSMSLLFLNALSTDFPIELIDSYSQWTHRLRYLPGYEKYFAVALDLLLSGAHGRGGITDTEDYEGTLPNERFAMETLNNPSSLNEYAADLQAEIRTALTFGVINWAASAFEDKQYRDELIRDITPSSIYLRDWLQKALKENEGVIQYLLGLDWNQFKDVYTGYNRGLKKIGYRGMPVLKRGLAAVSFDRVVLNPFEPKYQPLLDRLPFVSRFQIPGSDKDYDAHFAAAWGEFKTDRSENALHLKERIQQRITLFRDFLQQLSAGLEEPTDAAVDEALRQLKSMEQPGQVAAAYGRLDKWFREGEVEFGEWVAPKPLADRAADLMHAALDLARYREPSSLYRAANLVGLFNREKILRRLGQNLVWHAIRHEKFRLALLNTDVVKITAENYVYFRGELAGPLVLHDLAWDRRFHARVAAEVPRLIRYLRSISDPIERRNALMSFSYMATTGMNPEVFLGVIPIAYKELPWGLPHHHDSKKFFEAMILAGVSEEALLKAVPYLKKASRGKDLLFRQDAEDILALYVANGIGLDRLGRPDLESSFHLLWDPLQQEEDFRVLRPASKAALRYKLISPLLTGVPAQLLLNDNTGRDFARHFRRKELLEQAMDFHHILYHPFVGHKVFTINENIAYGWEDRVRETQEALITDDKDKGVLRALWDYRQAPTLGRMDEGFRKARDAVAEALVEIGAEERNSREYRYLFRILQALDSEWAQRMPKPAAGLEEKTIAEVPGNPSYPTYVLEDALFALIDLEKGGGILATTVGSKEAVVSWETFTDNTGVANSISEAASRNFPGAAVLRELITNGNVILIRASHVLNPKGVSADPDSFFWDRNEEEVIMATLWEERFHMAMDRLGPSLQQAILEAIRRSKNKWVVEARRPVGSTNPLRDDYEALPLVLIHPRDDGFVRTVIGQVFSKDVAAVVETIRSEARPLNSEVAQIRAAVKRMNLKNVLREQAVWAWDGDPVLGTEGVAVTPPAKKVTKRLLPIFYDLKTFHAIPLVGKGGVPFLVIAVSQEEEDGVRSLLDDLKIERNQYVVRRADLEAIDRAACLSKVLQEFSHYNTYPVDPDRPAWLENLLFQLKQEGMIPMGDLAPALQATEQYFQSLA